MLDKALRLTKLRLPHQLEVLIITIPIIVNCVRSPVKHDTLILLITVFQILASDLPSPTPKHPKPKKEIIQSNL